MAANGETNSLTVAGERAVGGGVAVHDSSLMVGVGSVEGVEGIVCDP